MVLNHVCMYFENLLVHKIQLNDIIKATKAINVTKILEEYKQSIVV